MHIEKFLSTLTPFFLAWFTLFPLRSVIPLPSVTSMVPWTQLVYLYHELSLLAPGLGIGDLLQEIPNKLPSCNAFPVITLHSFFRCLLYVMNLAQIPVNSNFCCRFLPCSHSYDSFLILLLPFWISAPM